jgi:hypothetical protein
MSPQPTTRSGSSKSKSRRRRLIDQDDDRVSHDDLLEEDEFLFHLGSDPEEATNLVAETQYAGMLTSLRNMADACLEEVGEGDDNSNMTAAYEAFAAAGGYAPWANVTFRRRVQQKYNFTTTRTTMTRTRVMMPLYRRHRRHRHHHRSRRHHTSS